MAKSLGVGKWGPGCFCVLDSRAGYLSPTLHLQIKVVIKGHQPEARNTPEQDASGAAPACIQEESKYSDKYEQSRVTCTVRYCCGGEGERQPARASRVRIRHPARDNCKDSRSNFVSFGVARFAQRGRDLSVLSS